MDLGPTKEKQVDVLRQLRRGVPIPNGTEGLTDNDMETVKVIYNIKDVKDAVRILKFELEWTKVIDIQFHGQATGLFDVITAKVLGGKTYVFHWHGMKNQRGLAKRSKGVQLSDYLTDVGDLFFELFFDLVDMLSNPEILVIGYEADDALRVLEKVFTNHDLGGQNSRNTFSSEYLVKEASNIKWRLNIHSADRSVSDLVDPEWLTREMMGHTLRREPPPPHEDQGESINYKQAPINDATLINLLAKSHLTSRLLINMTYSKVEDLNRIPDNETGVTYLYYTLGDVYDLEDEFEIYNTGSVLYADTELQRELQVQIEMEDGPRKKMPPEMKEVLLKRQQKELEALKRRQKQVWDRVEPRVTQREDSDDIQIISPTSSPSKKKQRKDSPKPSSSSTLPPNDLRLRLTRCDQQRVVNADQPDLRSTLTKENQKKDDQRKIDQTLSRGANSNKSGSAEHNRMLRALEGTEDDEEPSNSSLATSSRNRKRGFDYGQTVGKMPAFVAYPVVTFDMYQRSMEEWPDTDEQPSWETWASYMMYACQRIYKNGPLHSKDLQFPHLNPQLRFKDRTFQLPDQVEAQRKRNSYLKKYRRNRKEMVAPNYMQERPILSKTNCEACMNAHHFSDHQECLVVKAKLGLPNRPTLWAIYPCNMCQSANHTTPACDLLHALCTECNQRGHYEHECRTLTEEQKADRRHQWKATFHMGFLTRNCCGNLQHEWGLYPDIPDRVTMIPDEENYISNSDLEIPPRPSNIYNDRPVRRSNADRTAKRMAWRETRQPRFSGSASSRYGRRSDRYD